VFPRNRCWEAHGKQRSHFKDPLLHLKAWTDKRAALSAFDAVDGTSTRHVNAMDVGAVKAPTIRRSYPCKW
jgi:hypothetical protein